VDPREVLLALAGFFLALWAVYGLLAVLNKPKGGEDRSDKARR
jgi:hypothetical protein